MPYRRDRTTRRPGTDDPPPDLFRVLAHPARRAVVEFLGEGEAEAGIVADVLWERFRLTTTATSNHLRVLREAGVVTSTVVACSRVYELRAHGLDTICAWVDEYGRRPPPGRRPAHLVRPDPMW